MTKKTAVRINVFKKLWSIIKRRMGFVTDVSPILNSMSDEKTIYYLQSKVYCKNTIKPFENDPLSQSAEDLDIESYISIEPNNRYNLSGSNP